MGYPPLRKISASCHPISGEKKLQGKLDELTAKISQETAARDGLMKMKTVYEANPALGDPMSIQGQLTENGHRLDKLRSDLRRYQGWLEEAEGRAPGSPASTLSSRGNGNGSSPRRSSVSDEVESLSRSASDSSVNHNKNLTSLSSQGSSHSPESGLGSTGHLAPGHPLLAGSQFQDIDSENADEDEFYEQEPLPVLGRCKAIYTFEASSEGSIPLEEQEKLWLIETDQGDGWTRVRRLHPSHLDPMPEGFVPTSYIEVAEMFETPQIM